MNRITIFTPTFNRVNLLTNVYKSLKAQTNKNFIWLIIDDGSTDDTEKTVKKWIKEKKLTIEYYKKQNGGKHTAYNFALEKINTEYVLIALDSDDIIVKDGVEYLYSMFKHLTNEYVGIVCLRSNDENTKDKTCKIYNLSKLKNKSLQEALENNLFDAECSFLFKTDYIKKYKFPEIAGEKFFTEAYIYYQLNQKMLWSDKILTVGTYLDDGLTKNIYKLFLNSPNSWRLYNEIRMTQNKSFYKRLKYKVYFIAFCLLSGNSPFKQSFSNKILLLILYPVGYLGYLHLKRKKD